MYRMELNTKNGGITVNQVRLLTALAINQHPAAYSTTVAVTKIRPAVIGSTARISRDGRVHGYIRHRRLNNGVGMLERFDRMVLIENPATRQVVGEVHKRQDWRRPKRQYEEYYDNPEY